jgi:hypothetical protein
MKAGEKVSSSFIMAQMFLGAKIRQISYISKFLLAINASSTKYSYIPNQKGVVIEVDNLVFLHSAAHSGLSRVMSHSRGYASLTPAYGLSALRACFSFSPSNKKQESPN